MQTYKLVNPKIIGEFNDTIKATDQKDAADRTWMKLTKYMTKNLPRFLFTLENRQTGQLHNFQVDESTEGKIANYDITEFDSNLTDSQIKSFKNKLHKIEKKTRHLTNGMKGGRRNDLDDLDYLDDLDDEDEDDDEDIDIDDDEDRALYDKIKLIKTINSPQPIVYYWYSPQLYSYRRYTLPSIYIPTFIPPLLPYIEISLSSAWLQ